MRDLDCRNVLPVMVVIMFYMKDLNLNRLMKLSKNAAESAQNVVGSYLCYPLMLK